MFLLSALQFFLLDVGSEVSFPGVFMTIYRFMVFPIMSHATLLDNPGLYFVSPYYAFMVFWIFCLVGSDTKGIY